MKKAMMPAISLAALASHMPKAVIGAPRMDVGATEELLKKVQQSLDKVNSETKQTAENALNEAKKAGDVSAETKQTADQLLKAQTELSNAVKKMTEQLEGVNQKQLDISQQVADGLKTGRGAGAMSLGRAVLESHEKIKAFNGGTLSIDVKNAITTASSSAGGLIYHEEERDPVRMPRRRLLVRQLLTQGRTGSDLVTYRKQVLRTNAAGMVAEAGTYQASEYGWEKATEKVKKIGHITHISEEALADADQLQTEIDSELRYGLDLEEENQVLAGDGVGENLKGLMTEAPAFAAAAGLPNATRIDRLRQGLLQVALEDYIASAMLLSPVDWAAIELLKVSGTDNRYVWGNPGTGNTPMLWGKDVVDTNSMTAGEWLVGDIALAATYYDRQEAEVLFSTEHGTNFIEDMVTVKARKRVTMAIKRALAMVQGDFTFV
ncbi:MAG: phage major capsid protein [Alphaproteobacteria bacterium]|uniref:Putative capsid protein n=1 Tax=viral metagenome TaxID=1070528 RepID=A0A6M3KBF5_9ZZZZ|nr:phage major capsid protein [Alphaproteobacteria bacterium]MBU1280268.1 phage major capsid protein [Alphaproteobacteria bacterium]MBU1573007.1 phage major capsid protein [Alphaproteobacteria bacterium]MBU1827210.1 phage major capsid protein [Alphaproteobacteria bacterium]MBU2079966.1 phage major capsid protein [Alphaproteobacteria bacterium]